MKLFPVMVGRYGAGKVWVPWDWVEAHECQAMENHDQTLGRLAERGGLCPSELAAVMGDRRWHSMSDKDAWVEIWEKINDKQIH